MPETEPGAEILRETRGHVAILTINRPEARNAINAAVTSQLAAALDAIDEDKDVWVVVLTGAGDKAFSAGMDLKAFASGQGSGILANKHGFAGIAHREIPKPIIAAVNGVALAGGLEIVLSCDLVVAVEHASFGIPEVKRGLLAAGGGLIRLPKRLPMAVALELALTGDPIDAQRAFELGLVNRVVPAAELMEAALALAERITPNSPLAVRRSKAVMYAAAQVSEEAGWEISQEATRVVFGGPDAQEGATAFAEKRPPNWQVD
jgi:enoyl-CoA hydratase/carnithine racemase